MFLIRKTDYFTEYPVPLFLNNWMFFELLCRNYKVRCEYIAADLTKTDKVEELCKSVDQMFPDGIDILINNAGGSNVGLTQFSYIILEVLSILTYVVCL